MELVELKDFLNTVVYVQIFINCIFLQIVIMIQLILLNHSQRIYILVKFIKDTIIIYKCLLISIIQTIK